MSSVKATVKYNMVTIEGFQGNLLSKVTQLFEADIREAAVENSPVDTGTNARSIETKTAYIPGVGVMASIYTTSGYGGYLELGHRVHLGSMSSSMSSVNLFASIRGGQGDYVQGRPYLYPAVMSNLPKLYAMLGSSVPASAEYGDLFGGSIGDTYTGGISNARAAKREVLRQLKSQKGSYKNRMRNNRKMKIG